MSKIPLVIELNNSGRPREMFSAIKEMPYSFILDTSLYVKGLGKYTYLGADPFIVITSKNGITKIRYCHINEEIEVVNEHPLQVLKDVMRRYKQDFLCREIPFTGGAVGYFSYDFGRQLEKIPSLAEDDLQTPDFAFGLYDVVAAVDNTGNRAVLISTGLPYEQNQAARAEERASWFSSILKPGYISDQSCREYEVGGLKSNFTKGEYRQAVARAVEHILCGDIFQVNLSQRFELTSGADGYEIFKRLSDISPAPFSAYLNFDQMQVICSSMERFLKLDRNGEVQTCPIKGTRPRGKNKVEDLKNYTALKNSLKDKAELTMIVDLERNDLGRVCAVGSIRTEDCFRIEPYSTVYHLVSTIKGRLRKDKDIFDLIKAAFPGGSITGAPKIKAMEIIERLEPVRRGVYTGSLGYIGFDGRADLNIVIRTIIKKNGKFYFQVGGGITADSHPEAEYEETLDKARALMKALGFKRS
ncbi:para-aminobenzoate synthetase component 1 [Desulfohalotomaculum tongense]|uniref:aminodeoxychorismate synthase component I n=1 Tax=Desulforadius tongensis TaxID=1216062 RepID=UPI00195D7FC6|nr:aminodeoxychorismate synthase component I [Desulforadius tongensis]MBM7854594.1 para-aminobenzoate synthetase component 1 [Desulforadius tongensis]